MLPPKAMLETCPECGADMPPDKRFCNECGLDRQAYIAAARISDVSTASARRWMLILAVFYAVGSLVFWDHVRRVMPDDLALSVSIPGFVLAGLYFGCWLWARVHPLAASLTALILFALVIGLQALQDPSTLFGGFVVLGLRAVVLYILIVAVRGALRARRVRRATHLER